MQLTPDQKHLASIEADHKKLERVVRVLVIRIEKLERENQRLKYAIGRTSRDLTSTQVTVKGLK